MSCFVHEEMKTKPGEALGPDRNYLKQKRNNVRATLVMNLSSIRVLHEKTIFHLVE